MSKLSELDRRSSTHFDVILLWNRDDDTVSIDVTDWREETHFRVEVPRERALDAFHHPFVYAPLGIDAPEPVNR
jgi:hypothetical protein